jgi:hypothetical protein
MPLDQRAIQALSRMGYSLRAPELRWWDRIWDEEGDAFFWWFLERERRVREQADRWFPVLAAYAAECRRRSPIPDVVGLSPAKREQHRILREQMGRFVARRDRDLGVLGDPHRIPIISTSAVGFSAAIEVFTPLGLPRMVVLREGELAGWFRGHPEAESPSWWHVSYGCVLRDRFEAGDVIRPHLPAPEGTAYWMVAGGLEWGDLAGGVNHDLWRWDGRHAVFMETVARVCF